ncbi:hypothetical protein LWI28_027575 [Acer negundo]|uniref:Uncharacterized protein n=1 Tax=Acer negundo TaxID=4023 RepID=A0AAD5IHJ7_ACENE|nr:hypothetical protein LWI28_027575 [Acer negundo]
MARVISRESRPFLSCIEKLLGFLHVKNLKLNPFGLIRGAKQVQKRLPFDNLPGNIYAAEEGTDRPKYRFVGKSTEGCELWGRICAKL